MKIFFLNSSLGQHVATVMVSDGPGLTVREINSSAESRELLDRLRKMDPEEGAVIVHYRRTEETVCLNFHLEKVTMDILAALNNRKAQDRISQKPRVMVAPAGDRLPDDGFLEYRAVAGVKDLLDFSPTTVLLFSERPEVRDLLTVLVTYPNLFDANPVYLDGVEGVTYDTDFDAATWQLERVSYHTIIDEALQAARAEKEKKPVSTFDREIKQRSTAKGEIRPFTAFDVAKPTTNVEETDIAEDSQ